LGTKIEYSNVISRTSKAKFNNFPALFWSILNILKNIPYLSWCTWN